MDYFAGLDISMDQRTFAFSARRFRQLVRDRVSRRRSIVRVLLSMRASQRQMQLARFDGENWERFGKLISG
jgi:hypothetical protein